MKVILGVDGSPGSAAAVEFVKAMAWPAGTRMEIVHAIPPVHVAIPEAYLVLSDQLDVVRKDLLVGGHKHVEDVACALLGRGLAIDVRVIEKDPREALFEAARNGGADLIVVGSHGRSGFSKLFLGSVSSHVVTHAPCSVLVVRHHGSRW